MDGSRPHFPAPPGTRAPVHAPPATASLRARHRPTRVLCGRRLHALPRDTTRRRCAPAQRGGPPTRFPLPSIGKQEKYLAGHTPFARTRWQVVRCIRAVTTRWMSTVMEARRRLEQASAAPHAAPPRPRPPSRSPCSARLMSAASMACTRPPVGTASCTSATAHRAGFRRPREGFIRSLRGVHRSRHHPHSPRTLGPTPSCRPTSAEERADVRKKTC